MIPATLSKAVEMARAIAQGELRLLCPSMCLAPIRTNDPEDAALRGTGVIETSPRGGLRYRMAFEGGLPPSHWHHVGIPPAHVETVDELYLLVAIDSAGREWRSSPIRGRFSPLVDRDGHGEIVELLDTISYRQSDSSAEDPSVALIFPTPPQVQGLLSGWTHQVHTRGDVEILVQDTADHCQYQTEGCDVYIERAGDDPLIITAAPHHGEMVPMGFETRVLGALAFVLGRGFFPALSLRTQGNHTDWHISRGPYLDPEGMIRPPVIPACGATSDNILSLAAIYQDKIAREWPDVFGMHDPISGVMAEIALGSQGTLESASLALAIGVEAVGNAVRLRERYPAKTGSASLRIDKVIEYIQQWDGDKVTREFILKRLSQLRAPDFASCLYAFADAKQIDPAIITTWKKTRPRLAPGALVDTSELSPDAERQELQASVYSYYAMLGLVYRMIVDFLEYDGPLVDFAKPDWGISPGA